MGTDTAVAVHEPAVPLDHITQDLSEAVHAFSRFMREDADRAATEYGGRAAFVVSLILAVVLALVAPAYFDRAADRPAPAHASKPAKASRSPQIAVEQSPRP